MTASCSTSWFALPPASRWRCWELAGLEALNQAIAAAGVARNDGSREACARCARRWSPTDRKTVHPHRRRHPGAAGRGRHRHRPARRLPARMNAPRFAPPPAAVVGRRRRRPLAEDIGTGDATALLLDDAPDSAYLLCKEDCVLAGRPWFEACHRALDPGVAFDWNARRRRPHRQRARWSPPARTQPRAGDRRARVAELPADQRDGDHHRPPSSMRCGGHRRHHPRHPQDHPGLRIAQKYAVRVAVAATTASGLYGAVMLKENHIRAFGSVAARSERARALHPALPLIVEVETLGAVARGRFDTGCTRILIDDFDADTRREGGTHRQGRALRRQDPAGSLGRRGPGQPARDRRGRRRLHLDRRADQARPSRSTSRSLGPRPRREGTCARWTLPHRPMPTLLLMIVGAAGFFLFTAARVRRSAAEIGRDARQRPACNGWTSRHATGRCACARRGRMARDRAHVPLRVFRGRATIAMSAASSCSARSWSVSAVPAEPRRRWYATSAACTELPACR